MKPPFGINSIKNINLILAIIHTFASLLGLLLIDERFWDWVQTVFHTIILWCLFYGMAKVKSWVVIFILFVSYLGLLRACLEFFALQPDDFYEILQKAIFVFFTCLYIFQITIFSKTEVKDYFKSNGKYLIS
jgi:hypothetical protein